MTAVLFHGLYIPSVATIAKYGETDAGWKTIAARQGYACGACGKVPPSRRLNFDHEHVRGWKTMAPEQRRRYVRGLLCYMCNTKRLSRGATVDNLLGAADYLRDYETRKAQWPSK